MESADESSSMDSTDSDGSSGTEEHQGRGCIDLTLERLQSMRAVANAYRHDRSSYSANGRCRHRIKQAVQNPICACQCRVNMITLMKICLTFWLLTKDGQDSVLWAVQRGSARKNTWHIEGLVGVFFCMSDFLCMPNFLCLIQLGERVCKEAWMYMLAIGRKRLSRCKRSFGGKDGRSLPSYLDAAKSQNRN